MRPGGRSGRRIVAAFLAIVPGLALAQDLGRESTKSDFDRALAVQGRTGQSAIEAQRRIDALDEESRDALFEYRRVVAEKAELDEESERLERYIESQKAEKARIDRQISELEVTQRSILPLMDRMLEVLEEFVSLDLPFLPEERAMRLESLRADWDRPDIPISEKYRTLISAYRVEAEYGRTFEAYQDTVGQDGSPTVVDVLRLGRVGLYSLALDGRDPRIWDDEAEAWKTLDSSHRAALGRGLSIARRQAPPELVRLPLFKPEPRDR